MKACCPHLPYEHYFVYAACEEDLYSESHISFLQACVVGLTCVHNVESFVEDGRLQRLSSILIKNAFKLSV
jgi:hypothetical protein